MTTPEPSFENGVDHFSGRGNEFVEFYRSTAAGKIYVETKRRRIKEILPLARQVNILDLGGGPGYITIPFAAEGHHVTLLDRDASMLETARSILSEFGVEDNYTIIQGTMENLSEIVDESFDIVLNFSAMEICEYPLQPINEMIRVCMPGGKILLVTSNYLSHLKKSMRRLDLDTSKKLLETGVFNVLDEPKPCQVRGFRADELWGYFSSAGAELVYLKGHRMLDMLLSEDHIEKMAGKWGLDECINIEMALADDPALAGAGMDYCVLAAKR